jgi:GDP-mannose 4,6-dehydratase
MEILTNCRICKSKNLVDVIKLGEQYITSRFPMYNDFSTPKTNITLCLCEDCSLVQLKETTASCELYEHEYGYRSGISNTMKDHLKEYQEQILSKVFLEKGDTIVDIGSNDSTMLQYYSSEYTRIGIDPTGKQFEKYYGDVKLIPTYFTADNFKKIYGNTKCKIVSSISMFYDLPDPVQFAKDINEILHDDGIWTCEQSYLPYMLETNSIDTICHEHLEYYSFHQIKEIADRANLKILDVFFNSCNGGSFRIYFAKRTSSVFVENRGMIDDIIQKEKSMNLSSVDTYKKFTDSCDREIKYLNDFIDNVNKDGKSVYIYGASTKGNCLLQYGNIGQDKIKYAVERNPNKIGKMTSTGVEIIGEETMRKNPPNYLLVLPWHFRSEIIKREEDFLRNGGQLLFPFPKFEIHSYKPKVLITGCDGMISHYLKSTLKDYTLYGISRNKVTEEKNTTKFYFDMNNTKLLEESILTIKPDIIVHLASISSSNYALSNPIDTLNSNGMLTAYLCDIIKNSELNIKLFNASSSEMYKGHINYTVEEDDTHMYHLHPYSIAKILGHSVVDFYRNTYGLPFSNGVIFTTESEIKRPEFLVNKVKNHSNLWKQTKEPLILGNLDSYRNILHASDVASAVELIIRQEKGDTYIICNDTSIKMYDLVLQMYEDNGIKLNNIDNVLYDVKSGMKVLVIENKVGNESIPTNIKGKCEKLKKIGWKPKTFRP